MKRRDVVFQSGNGTGQPAAQPSRLAEALKGSIQQRIHVTPGRVGRCIGCGKWLVDHFDARNEFIPCADVFPQSSR